MNLSNKNIIEITGIIAVVISLIFVALELRENRIAARTASYQEVGIAVANAWFMLSSDPELLEIFDKLQSEDLNLFDSLPNYQRARARSFMVGTLRNYEVLYLQVQEGLLDENSLKFLGFGIVLSGPSFQRLWPDIKQNVTPGFREYLENELRLIMD
ncbi:MAG: hypothetical protein HQ498_05370 [Pseudohongiella sp.]|nr:hypothetical protein [Pseudohongiella sp.]